MTENRGKYWVTEPHQILEPVISPKGYGSKQAKTVVQCFKETVMKFGNERALALKRPEKMGGAYPSDWQIWTWNDYYRDAVSFAKALIHLDVPRFSIINIIGFNSPEWVLALLGSLLGGCIGAGVYTSNTPDACQYVASHSKTPIVVCENNKQLLKYAQVQENLPDLKAIVVWEEEPDKELVKQFKCKVYSWRDFLALGSAISEAEVDNRALSLVPGNCASLIYTSGTTGNPKAVMISHDNLTWTSKNIIDHYMSLNHTDRVVSYLPLSHIAAQLIDIFCMMIIGGCCYFAQPDALKGSLTVTLKEVKPTFFFGVPRVWEKIQEKMVEIGRSTTGIKKSLSTWAKSAGIEKNKACQYGSNLSIPWGYGCANSLVLSKIREALGLDQVKGCFTAAAPISPDVLWYFASLDIPVFEVFGQSECTGPHTVSFHDKWKIGSCGRPIKGSQSRINEATGELQYKGRHIFMGYMFMPKETAETIDDEGYLRSGDIAEFDDDHDPEIPTPSSFMRITGRIKELLITAGGENVPPVLIENEMKGEMMALSNCMVVGDQKKFLTMMVSLKVVVDSDGIPTDKLAPDSLFVANNIGSQATTYSEVKEDPIWTAYINNGMKKANQKTTSNAQIIQKWVWLPVDFSEKEGDLTPTLKLKRKVVTQKYNDLIDTMYNQTQ